MATAKKAALLKKPVAKKAAVKALPKKAPAVKRPTAKDIKALEAQRPLPLSKKTIVQAIATVLPPATKPKKRPALKIPKALGAVADLLYTTKNERLALDRESKVVKEDEGKLKTYIIDNLPKSQASGIQGRLVKVGITKRVIPQPSDWTKIYAYIVEEYLKQKKKKTGQEDGAFAILQRSLGEAAITEMWEAGLTIPGVVKFNAVSLSINKI